MCFPGFSQSQIDSVYGQQSEAWLKAIEPPKPPTAKELALPDQRFMEIKRRSQQWKYDQAQRELQRRAAPGLAMQRIADERTAILQQQSAEMARLQSMAATEQERQAAVLQAQEQQQQQRIMQGQLASGAAAASMRILQSQAGSSAPAAAMTPATRPGMQRRSNPTGLRIGATSAAPGVGLNIGG